MDTKEEFAELLEKVLTHAGEFNNLVESLTNFTKEPRSKKEVLGFLRSFLAIDTELYHSGFVNDGDDEKNKFLLQLTVGASSNNSDICKRLLARIHIIEKHRDLYKRGYDSIQVLANKRIEEINQELLDSTFLNKAERLIALRRAILKRDHVLWYGGDLIPENVNWLDITCKEIDEGRYLNTSVEQMLKESTPTAYVCEYWLAPISDSSIRDIKVLKSFMEYLETFVAF